MRHLDTFSDENFAHSLYIFLLQQKIDSKLESSPDGSFDLWIVSEDQYEKAKELYEEYKENPKSFSAQESQATTEQVRTEAPQPPPPPTGPPKLTKMQLFFAPLTRALIALCVAIYALTAISSYKEAKEPGLFPNLPPLITTLLYDYPEMLKLGAELDDTYNVKSKEDLAMLPPEGQALLDKMYQEPMWTGLYNIISNWKERELLLKARLFGDIREGQVWRLVSPIFLHASLLHILFNMLWLWILGKMLEKNMGALRLICFIVVTAIVTNTLQYLMTGPMFMGFSGVISAMAGYVWIRKKAAPWELYPIDNSTLIFLWIFIFGLLTLQIIAFFLNIFHIVSTDLQIANTAHVSGVLLGLCLAKVKIFQRST